MAGHSVMSVNRSAVVPPSDNCETILMVFALSYFQMLYKFKPFHRLYFQHVQNVKKFDRMDFSSPAHVPLPTEHNQMAILKLESL